MFTSIKTEDFSQSSFSSKKLGIVDKWRARVLLSGEENSWIKKIEKHMAVLRVAYPFLTERQLRGKAWKSCGLTSVMGGIPRLGLSPKIKKEFLKEEKVLRKKDNHLCSNIFQKRRVKKEKIKLEVKEENCRFAFQSPNMDHTEYFESPLDTSSNTQQSEFKTSQTTSKGQKEYGMTTYNVVFTPDSDDAAQQKSRILSEKNSPRQDSLLSLISPKNYFSFSKEKESSSSDGNYFLPSQNSNLHCISKQNFDHISTQDLIGDQLSAPSANSSNFGSHRFAIDNTPSQADATVNTALDLNSTPIKSRNSNAKQKIIFEDGAEYCLNDIMNSSLKETLDTQELLKSNLIDYSNLTVSSHEVSISMPSCKENLAYQNTNNNFVSGDPILNTQIDENSSLETFAEFSKEESPIGKDFLGGLFKNPIYNNPNSYKKPKIAETLSQGCNYINLPISPFQTQDFLTQNSSQSMMLPPTTLLSNYCSEYDKAYSKPDLKPNAYRSSYSSSHNESLKLEFNQIIPLSQTYQEFFKAEGKSFKKVQSKVRKQVIKILDFLDNDIED